MSQPNRFLHCLFCLLLGPVMPMARAEQSATIQPVDLRCEYLRDPLGLDVATPRLSWRLEATSSGDRGQKQTAYQILIASTRETLDRNQGDLWNPDPVRSDNSSNIAYQGKSLVSGRQCFWKLRVTDEKGVWSAWSRPGRWSMGPLAPADWKAQWIGARAANAPVNSGNPADNTVPDPWFRKTFSLPEAPDSACIHVASVGYHELYVNGRKAGDAVLAPSATDHCSRARYVTYDVAPLLKPGPNVIALWLGVSWSIFPAYQTADKPAAPIVLAQADIRLPRAGCIQLATDNTWKTHRSPNMLLGFWDAHGFGGELYDANLEQPGWCETGFDDSGWDSATVFHPKLALSADKTEPNRLVKEIKPVSIKETGSGIYRVDMGVNYAGWFEMPLSGQPGDRVEFQFAEREKEEMSFGLHSTYIIGPGGKGVFRNRFNYMSGRWVRISGLRSMPDLNGMRGWLIRSDYQRASAFECDQPLLNRIYDTTLWTFENLTLGAYLVDCPQRERRGYGDGYGATRTALDNYQMGAFCTKWAEDWRDVQAADGNVAHTAPTYLGGGGPAWSGFCVTLPWETYQRYGDKRILQENFPTIQRWLSFLETKSRQSMLVRYGGNWGFLGDWQWPRFSSERREVEKTGKFLGDTRESLFFNNCYWIHNLDTAAKIADVLGKNQVAETYRKRAGMVRSAVHRAFYNPAGNSYVNGYPAYLAIALQVDLPPRDLRPKVWQRLEQEIMVMRKGHVWAGIIGGAYLFNTLLENDRNDLIYAMAGKEDYPGWGDMLKRGATTFHEDWDRRGSYLHSSYLYIGSWFIRSLGGIKQAGPDYQHFVIEPWINQKQGPQAVRTHYDSSYGRIATDWKIENGVLQLDLTVPPNTDARLRLHGLKPGSLQESGRPVTGASSQQNMTTLQLAAGNYRFSGTMATR